MMNLTKKLLTLLLAMLALMGCKDSKDEPDYSKPPRIYVAINETLNSYVCDIEGNVIHECPENSHIIKLASEGKDWYAVRSRVVDINTVLYEVLKNGKVEFQIPNPAEGMCVKNGDVYTYQYDKNQDNIFIYKNNQLLYKYGTYDYDIVYNSFDVVDGHLVAGIYGRWGGWIPPSCWIDGNKLTLSIDPSFDHVALEAYAREGTDDLIVIRDDDDDGSLWYQFKGQSHELPSAYLVSQALIVDGIPYVLAYNSDMDQALLYVDGVKYSLNPPIKDNDAYQWWYGLMRRYGNDVYVLTNTFGSHSQIYKRNVPMDMGARIELKHVVGDLEHEKPLSDCRIVDFIVLPPK